MDNQEKYEHWEDIAKYDLDTAEAMYQAGRYLYVVFMCHYTVFKNTFQSDIKNKMNRSKEVFAWLQSLRML